MRKTMVMVPTVALLALLALLAGCQGQGSTEKVNPWQEMVPGVSYVDSSLGQGPVAEFTSYVQVHYTGYIWEADEKGHMGRGRKFDSSRDRHEPLAFPLGVGRVIEGWEKGIVGMSPGARRTLLVQPEMAYGEQGMPPLIPANATLCFDVELLSLPKVTVEILEEGDGPEALFGDRLSVHYTGWLWEDGAKGTQFDTSSNRGRPHQFALGFGQVIDGWDRAIEGMRVGTKARLIIPPSMGYGSKGSGRMIPPNATLCFEVELVKIEGKS